MRADQAMWYVGKECSRQRKKQVQRFCCDCWVGTLEQKNRVITVFKEEWGGASGMSWG